MSYLERLLDGAEVAWLPLGEVVSIKTGESVSKQKISEDPGEYPVINSGRDPLGYIGEWNTENDPIGITTRGAGVGSITWQEGKYFRGNLNYAVSIKSSSQMSVRYLYHLLLLMQHEIQALCTFDGIPALNAGNLKGLQIPIPCPENTKKSLAIQVEIVRILDAFTSLTAELTAELTARKKQYNYYRDKLLTFSEEKVEWKPLGSICNFVSSGKNKKKSDEGQYPVYGSTGIIAQADEYFYDEKQILVARVGANAGYVHLADGKYDVSDNTIIVNVKNDYSLKFLFYILTNMKLRQYAKGAGQPLITSGQLKEFKIPIPHPNDPKKSLAEQERIAAILDKFDAIAHSISEGLPREIELRQKQYVYYRDQLLNFPKPEKAAA